MLRDSTISLTVQRCSSRDTCDPSACLTTTGTVQEITNHTLVHEQLISFYRGFKHDAHPMAIMVGVVGALAAFYPGAADIKCATTCTAASRPQDQMFQMYS